jgi:CDGSH-type Zn-finger protein
MSNHCYCGHSEIMPYCDGSHATLDQRPAPEVMHGSSPATPVTHTPPDRKNILDKIFAFFKNDAD